VLSRVRVVVREIRDNKIVLSATLSDLLTFETEAKCLARGERMTTKHKVIGTDTRYIGDELKFLRGARVRIIAVLHDALRPGADVDGDDYLVRDDDHLARLGGITRFDRIEVAPFIGERLSFVTSDPRAIDLECFAALKHG
jgi:hypothetical protein